jgi:transposase
LWNAVFAGVALDLGLGIEVCRPSSPEQKGSIENLVGWVKGSFFKQRRFLDDADLLTQLAEWRTEVNTQRPCRATAIEQQTNPAHALLERSGNAGQALVGLFREPRRG